MSMNTFGEASMKQLNTLHPDLQLILIHTIVACEVDFSLTEGYRSTEKQFEYFKQGRKQTDKGDWIVVDQSKVITNVDGYKIVGTHSYNPSIAVDIAVYVPGKPKLTFDDVHLAYIAGSMLRVADRLYAEGRIKHKLRWGGNWNGNGDLSDNILSDKPHFELIKP